MDAAQAAMDEMSVHQARLQIAAARERAAKMEALQQLEEQRTEKEAALEVRVGAMQRLAARPLCQRRLAHCSPGIRGRR